LKDPRVYTGHKPQNLHVNFEWPENTFEPPVPHFTTYFDGRKTIEHKNHSYLIPSAADNDCVLIALTILRYL